jgi:hypothetical protein
MLMKLEEFLALKQEDQSIMQYVGRFNHLAQYAPNHVNLDHKKKAYFMRGLNSKIQTMMTGCLNASYHEAVNVAIASEEEYCKHKEAKKKKNVSFLSSTTVPDSATGICPTCCSSTLSTIAECPWHLYPNPTGQQQLSLLQLWEAGSLLEGVLISKAVQSQLSESSYNSIVKPEPE